MLDPPPIDHPNTTLNVKGFSLLQLGYKRQGHGNVYGPRIKRITYPVEKAGVSTQFEDGCRVIASRYKSDDSRRDFRSESGTKETLILALLFRTINPTVYRNSFKMWCPKILSLFYKTVLRSISLPHLTVTSSTSS